MSIMVTRPIYKMNVSQIERKEKDTSNKNHVYKERKETTHARVGERNIHQHIKKISTMYVNNGHKTGVQEEGKHSP